MSHRENMKAVLIVDDDQNFATLLKTALVGEQITPIVAPKAADATVELFGRKFDLIILDGELPDKNGMSWLSENRQKVGSTPVMFVSASWRDTDSHMKLVNELGVRCIVHKPVSLEVLVDETLRIVRSDAKPSDPNQTGSAELAVNYIRELTGEFKRLSDFIRYTNPGQFERVDWAEPINAAHKIHGTGGIFEFHEISRIAAVIEQELKAAAAANRFSDAQRLSLSKQLTRAAEELNHAKALTEKRFAELSTQDRYHARVAGEAAQRVLIVDDDTFFLKRLEHLLAAENILLNSYSDSKQVVDAITKFVPELLVLDINMPGLNGFEVCRQVRKTHPTLPIILISADCSDDVRARATESGANHFAAKPIKNMQFVALIKEMLGGK